MTGESPSLRRGDIPATRYVSFHEIPEHDTRQLAGLSYAVMMARSARGVLLVHSRIRQVWELPGGAIDPGESPRQTAIRELVEESGCVARDTRWLGVLEVNDGRSRFGAVLYCELDDVPQEFSNAETIALGYWNERGSPAPLAHPDEMVLRKFA